MDSDEEEEKEQMAVHDDDSDVSDLDEEDLEEGEEEGEEGEEEEESTSAGESGSPVNTMLEEKLEGDEEDEESSEDVDDIVVGALKQLKELDIGKREKTQYAKIRTHLWHFLIKDLYEGGGQAEDFIRDIKRAQRNGVDLIAFLNNCGTSGHARSKITPGNDEDDLFIFMLNVTEHIIPQEVAKAEYFDAVEGYQIAEKEGDVHAMRKFADKLLKCEEEQQIRQREVHARSVVKPGSRNDPFALIETSGRFMEEALLIDDY